MNNEKKNENEGKSTLEKIEKGVVDGYKKIETGVVDGYKKIEKGAVEGFNKVSDGAIKTLFSKDAESVEDTKKRLSGKKDQ